VQNLTPSLPIGFGASEDNVPRLAYDSYAIERIALPALVDAKRELIKLYDIDGMTRTATILHGGSTGSVLAAIFFWQTIRPGILPSIRQTTTRPSRHYSTSMLIDRQNG
jgi:hypothetical protein